MPAATRARGQCNDLNKEILASNLINCRKDVINAPPVPSISRCIHIVYRHKNVWEYQWSNFIYNCMSTFLHYVHCKDALLDCSAPGGERCESLTWVDEIVSSFFLHVLTVQSSLWKSLFLVANKPAVTVLAAWSLGYPLAIWSRCCLGALQIHGVGRRQIRAGIRKIVTKS